MPVVHHQHILVLPRPRLRSCRRPLHVSPVSGRYSLPRPILDRLQAALAPAKNRESALTPAVFVARFWSAPGRLGLPFPIDRRALCGHRDLPLTEARIRGAIAVLEEIGFIEREEPEAGRRYQRKPEGLRRWPIAFLFGAEFEALFAAANKRPHRGFRATQDRRRPLPVSPPATRPRPSWVPPEQPTNSPKNTPQNPTLVHLGEVREGYSRTSLALPEARRDSGASQRLEGALARLGALIGAGRKQP